VVTGNINYSGAALGMSKYASNHIGVALFPSPFVLLNLPNVQDVAHQIKRFAGVVFEEVIEFFSLAVPGTQV
jgi:hypothetical protein